MTVPEVYALMDRECLLMEDFQGHPFKEDRQGRINVICAMEAGGTTHADIAAFFGKKEKSISSICNKYRNSWKRNRN